MLYISVLVVFYKWNFYMVAVLD